MQVIADLHGGDPEDTSAKAEFQEIKDRVNSDVSCCLPLRLSGTLKVRTAGIWRGTLLQSHVGEVQA